MVKLVARGGKIVKTRDHAKGLIDAALIWHAATFLSGQETMDTLADKGLRRAAVKYLKATQCDAAAESCG